MILGNSQDRNRILIIEDEAIIAVNIKNTLKQFGYEAEFKTSGESALEFLEEGSFTPDLILMDINLGSGLDGIETAQKIHEKGSIPIIYLTAFSDQDTLDRAQITDPFGYIVKPFQGRELYISIEMALYKNRSIQTFQEMQERLYESQRMESIGLLSSGIAHEINNPLMSVLNFSLLGIDESQSEELGKIRKYFETIHKESEKISIVVKNLIQYAREDRDNWVWVSIGDLIRESLALYNQLLIKDGIRVEIAEAPEIPKVYCKSQKIKQVILNMVTYCRVAVLENKESKDRFIKIHIDLDSEKGGSSPRFILFSFQDSGNKIAEEERYPGFKPFLPYEKSYSLADLGYYLSQGIMKEHNGSIRTIRDENSRIQIALPEHPKEANSSHREA
jgi:CheY-like chemotaxis protein